MADRYVCIDSRSELHSFADDGARCGNAIHWHVRTRSGFAGARAQPSVVYADVSPEPVPLAAGSTETDD